MLNWDVMYLCGLSLWEINESIQYRYTITNDTVVILQSWNCFIQCRISQKRLATCQSVKHTFHAKSIDIFPRIGFSMWPLNPLIWFQGEFLRDECILKELLLCLWMESLQIFIYIIYIEMYIYNYIYKVSKPWSSNCSLTQGLISTCGSVAKQSHKSWCWRTYIRLYKSMIVCTSVVQVSYICDICALPWNNHGGM